MKIFSVGHSSRGFGEFLSLLKSHRIEILVDVRSYPKSSRFPHFNRESLEILLEGEGIVYLHTPELGGMRRESYADYMKDPEFKKGVAKLIKVSESGRAAFMCAEKDWRKCHRRFISEELVRRGIDVFHIIDNKRVELHPRGIFMI